MISTKFLKVLIAIAVIAFIAVSGAKAQLLTEYTVNEYDGVYTPISGTYVGTGDDRSFRVNLPFTFIYDEQEITYVYCGTNGWMSLNRNYGTWYPYYANYTPNIIAFYAADLYTVGEISYEIQGSAPNRVAVFQWREQYNYSPRLHACDVQIKLYETTGRFDIVWAAPSSAFGDRTGSMFATGGSTSRYINIQPGNPSTFYFSNVNPNTTQWMRNPYTDNIHAGKTYSFTTYPALMGAFPAQDAILRRGTIVNDENKPGVVMENNQMDGVYIKYSIEGPLPASNPQFRTVYTATVEGDETDDMVPVYNNGRTNFTHATGFIARTDPDNNGDIDLETNELNIPGGTYKVKAEMQIPSVGFTQELADQTFIIALENDLAINRIISPKPKDEKKYPLSTGRIRVQCRVQNYGINDVTEFDAVARIYKDDEQVYEEDFEWSSTDPMSTGEYVDISFPDYRPFETGDFDIVFEVTMVGVLDRELSNNRWPKTGDHYWFEVAHEIEAEALDIIDPTGEVFVGRPVKPLASFQNNGVSDISDIDAEMVITNSDGDVVYRSPIIIQDIPQGRSNKVIVDFDDFVPPAAGEYTACITITSNDDPVTDNNSICEDFSVVEALSGTYTIGTLYEGNIKNFLTFEAALDQLYRRGMTGPVTFELTDAVYNIGSLDRMNQPAIDMSSTIVGLSEDQPIVFKPSRQRAVYRAGVKINMVSDNGIGIYMGQNMAPSNSNAPVHIVRNSSKKNYSNFPGFVTFDGGANKAFQFSIDSDEDFRTVFYLAQGASNVTIKNCIIRGDYNTTPSFDADLPKMVFNSAQSQFLYEDDIRTSGTYSAGILLRSLPPTDDKQTSNLNALDSLFNQNNVIENNEITGFGYGIASMGMGVLFKQEANNFVKYYNMNNEYKDNVIHNVSRAAIFLGSEQNSTIKNNRIYEINGVSGMDAAGIILGGDAERDWFGYNVIDITVDGNEISEIDGDYEIRGIKVSQDPIVMQAPGGGLSFYPDRAETVVIKNNVIRNLNPENADVKRCGIQLSTQRAGIADEYMNILTPARKDYLSRNDIIANNTIIITDDAVENVGATAGIMLQQVDGAVLKNNAIAFEDEEFADNAYTTTAILLQSEWPEWGAVTSDRNAFDMGNANADLIRFIHMDEDQNVIEYGQTGEFANIAQWQVWTKQDENSVVGEFLGDLDYTGNYPYQLRVVSDPYPLGCILNNRGGEVTEVEYDIDGNLRGAAGQRYDIGAFEFSGRMYVSDVEMLNVPTPGAYRAGMGTFSDAEYIMTEAPTNIVASLRNNGTLQQSNINVYAKIYREQPDGSFSDTVEIETTVKTSIPTTESVDVDFLLDDEDGVDFYPQTYGELGFYNVPDQFAGMESNVTPRYRIVISVESDQYNSNNVIDKVVRFYVKRSSLGLLASARDIATEIYWGEPTTDEIAGKLNLDSLREGLRKVGWVSDLGEGQYDIDLFNRLGWEPRSVNYTMYKTLLWSDGDENTMSRYEKMDIESFLEGGMQNDKKNLVIGSQELVRQLGGNASSLDYDPDFLDEVFRAEYVTPGNPMGAGVSNSGNTAIGISVGTNLENAIVATSYEFAEDEDPYCSLMKVTQNGEGLARPAYYYTTHTATPSDSTLGVAVTSLSKNIVTLGVDWRHWADMEDVLRQVLDFLDQNGGSVVPVELTSFDAIAAGQRVDLSWETASEYKSSHFEIEKAEVSQAGMGSFMQIGRMKAAGTSSYATQYGPVVDYDVNYGNTYAYRLKMVDIDGSYDYSDEEVVTIGGNEMISLGQAYPNPSKESAKFELTTGNDVNVSIDLYDMSGKLVRNVLSETTSGTVTVEVDTRDLTSGSYTLVLRSGSTIINRTVRVVK